MRSGIVSLAILCAGCAPDDLVVLPENVDFTVVLDTVDDRWQPVTGLMSAADSFELVWDTNHDRAVIGFESNERGDGFFWRSPPSSVLRLAGTCEARLPTPSWSYALPNKKTIEATDIPPLTADWIIERCRSAYHEETPESCLPCGYTVSECSDISTTSQSVTIDADSFEPLTTMMVLPNDSIFVGTLDSKVAVIDLEGRVQERHFNEHLTPYPSMAFDGNETVFIGFGGGVLHQYDLQGRLQLEYPSFGDFPIKVASDGQGLVIAYGLSDVAYSLSAGSTQAIARTDFPPNLLNIEIQTSERMAALDSSGQLFVFEDGVWMPLGERIAVNSPASIPVFEPIIQMAFVPGGVVVVSEGSPPQEFRFDTGRWRTLFYEQTFALAVTAWDAAQAFLIGGQPGVIWVYRPTGACVLKGFTNYILDIEAGVGNTEDRAFAVANTTSGQFASLVTIVMED